MNYLLEAVNVSSNYFADEREKWGGGRHFLGIGARDAAPDTGI